MLLPKRSLVVGLSLAMLGLAFGLADTVWAAGKMKFLYTFKGGSDGFSSPSSVVLDEAGNLYGTTTEGGGSSNCSMGCGTVFELSPAQNGKWAEKILYAFAGGIDGAFPSSDLIFDSTGNLYGATLSGGTGTNCDFSRNGFGTIFELSPNSDGSWTKTSLYSFLGNPDGAGPNGNLVLDRAGNLYGTTFQGGQYEGTVFELSPPAAKGRTWIEQVIYTFPGGTPRAGLIMDSSGNLLGTTYYGGNSGHCALGCGTAFELQQSHGSWSETVLYNFQGGGNGQNPQGGLVRDAKGNFYGTLSTGGNGGGAAFTLRNVGGVWKEKMIYNFCSHDNCIDGDTPLAGLTLDSAGRLYGVTQRGGRKGSGVLFRLQRSGRIWKETVLHNFGSRHGDGFPEAALVFDNKGNAFGTTAIGDGTVFQFTP